MEVSQTGLDLIKHEEGLPPAHEDGLFHSYHGKADKAGIWTIGYGTTWLPDGSAVTEGMTATEEQIDEWLAWHVNRCASAIISHVPDGKFNQNQFDALISFAYNIGTNGLLTSTLFKKALANPMDATIYTLVMAGTVPRLNTCEFMKWVHSNGQVVDDLVFRRGTEAILYSQGRLQYFGH